MPDPGFSPDLQLVPAPVKLAKPNLRGTTAKANPMAIPKASPASSAYPATTTTVKVLLEGVAGEMGKYDTVGLEGDVDVL